jgi:O-antigen/teichoic acid export membrane protein
MDGRESFLFWKRIAVVMSGSAMAQAITFASTPIVTRMVTPDVLGPYFIWLGVASVLSIFLSLRLDVAIFNAKTHKHLLVMIQIGVVMAVILAAMLWVVALGIKTVAPTFIALLRLDWWYEEALVISAVWAINMLVQSAYLYGGHFKRQAFFKIILAFAVAFSQITAISLGLGVQGIINLQILATATVLLINLIDISNIYKFKLCDFSSLKIIIPTLRNNWRFPVFSMPADMLSVLTSQMPVFVLGQRFSSDVAGEYALMNKSTAAPTKLIAGSVMSVFKEEASRQFREHGDCKAVYLKSLKRLAFLGVVPFCVLYLFSEYFFGVFFGEEWRQAGVIASIMAPMLYVQFVASPLSYTLYLSGLQLMDLCWQIAMAILSLAAFVLVVDKNEALFLYSYGMAFMYLINLRFSYVAACGKTRNNGSNAK